MNASIPHAQPRPFSAQLSALPWALFWALLLGLISASCWAQKPQQPSTMPAASTNTAIQEIQALHQFFEDWFIGRLEKTPAAFARFEQVMAPEMSFIAPSGAPLNRAALVDFLWQSNGKNQHDTLRIWTENETARRITDDLVVAIYEEHQMLNGEHTVRRSSVLFQANTETPLGWQWQHVHETWLADQETQ
jgi:hypothetical protein